MRRSPSRPISTIYRPTGNSQPSYWMTTFPVLAVNSKKAETLKARMVVELNSGEYSERRKIRLQDFKAEHLRLAAAEVARATVALQRRALDRFIAFCGYRLLDQIARRGAEEFRARLVAEGAGPATTNKYMRTLKAVFQRAVRDKFLRENPFRGIKPLREPERVHRTLDPSEVGQLLAACPNDLWRTFVCLAVTTGMRKGELQFLEWSDVHFDQGVIFVQCKAEHRTKNAKSRIVPLVPRAAEMLRRLRPNSPGRWVFQTKDGEPVLNNTNRMLNRILAEAVIPHCTFHDMRRTVCTELARQKVNMAVAQTLLGHACISTTRRYYTQVMPDSVREATLSLPWAQGKIAAPTSPRGESIATLLPPATILPFKARTA